MRCVSNTYYLVYCDIDIVCSIIDKDRHLMNSLVSKQTRVLGDDKLVVHSTIPIPPYNDILKFYIVVLLSMMNGINHIDYPNQRNSLHDSCHM